MSPVTSDSAAQRFPALAGTKSARKIPSFRRMVCFYDLLGWKKKIQWAGQDEDRIALLYDITNLFKHFSDGFEKGGTAKRQMSTFSDNVVISQQAKDPENFLVRIALTQVTAALSGFWIRGAVTIGHITHNERVVFGPALVRAYELESQKAIYPRIILDPNCVKGFSPLPSFVVSENDEYFLDPFTTEFLTKIYPEVMPQLPVDQHRPAPVFAEAAHRWVIEQLTSQMSDVLAPKDWMKLEWLYERIRNRIRFNVPAAGSLKKTVLHNC